MQDAKQMGIVGGDFKRSESKHRKQLGTPEHPVESGRYLVYIALACPWASRVSGVIDLLKLEKHIEVVSVAAEFEKTKPDDPKDDHHGWVFAKEKQGKYIRPDPIFGAKTLREVYEKCGDSVGRFTTPVLFDKQKNVIVNNESSEVIRMISKLFLKFSENPIDLYPEELSKEIDEVNSWVYSDINNGVYRSGFAREQGPYDEAVTGLFKHLDRAEEILSKQRYLCGETLTEADIRLFETLVRFDHVYHTHFKCNKKRVMDYPNLLNYTREIYQLIPSTVDLHEIKTHYYRSHPFVNPSRVVAIGPDVTFDLPHDRDRFSSKKGRM